LAGAGVSEAAHTEIRDVARSSWNREALVSRLESIELLESTHQFPCPFVFKAIGKADGGFVARVVAVVRDELTGNSDPPYTVRQTSGGRHVAVTLEPHVQTASQVLAVYRRIEQVAGIVMVL
jgi:putative lipoic acid-binding regulatory protein